MPVDLADGVTVHVEQPLPPEFVVDPPSSPPVLVVPVIGARGPRGPAGDPTALSYTHVQTVPSDVWQITHRLGYRPSGIVVIEDGADPVEYSAIEWPTTNTVTLRFGAAISGTATLS